MTAKWRLVATLNSRAREMYKKAEAEGKHYIAAAILAGEAKGYKDAARLVAGMPENARMKEVDVLGPVL